MEIEQMHLSKTTILTVKRAKVKSVLVQIGKKHSERMRRRAVRLKLSALH